MSVVYAHRGASGELPENTLAAFEKAVAYGVKGIELDVHLSADGVPVVIHDETVDRTTDGTGSVADLTVAELAALDAGNGEKVPTLAEVLSLAAGKLHVNIEVKAAAAADAVLEEVTRHPGLEFAISSFIHDVLRHARRNDGDVELWPLIGALSDDAIETALEIAAPQLNIHDAMVSADVIDYARSKGLGLWVWTVNDPERAVELIRLGAVGICTDVPNVIERALQGNA